MKQLQKYWFSYTLIAVIFGLLGFLFGRQNASCHHAKKMMFMNKHGIQKMLTKDGKHKMMLLDGKDGNVEIEIDSTMQNGEKQIKVRVKKEKK